VRYDACEELRISLESSPEIINALLNATQDEESWVASSAKLALQADVHHQMAIKMGIVAPDKEEVVNIQPDHVTELELQTNLPESWDESTRTPDLKDSVTEEDKGSLPGGVAVSASPTAQESLKPRWSKRKKTISITICVLVGLGIIASVTLLTRIIIPRIKTFAAVTHFNRGEEYFKTGDYDSAISEYDRAIQLNPNNIEAYTYRGNAYDSKGDIDRAISDFDQAIQLDPSYGKAYINRGVAYIVKGDLDRAISDLNKAIQLDPSSYAAYSNRGSAYQEKGDLDHAISDYDQSIQLNPNDATTFYNRGVAYHNKGDLDHAIRDYDQAIQLNPNEYDAYYSRGLAYSLKGDPDRAISDFNTAIQLDPNNAEAYYYRGLAYTHKGEAQNVIADLKKALELCGSDAQLCQYAQQALQQIGGK
jgi:tetratricopeptide (TPR) repeat protein